MISAMRKKMKMILPFNPQKYFSGRMEKTWMAKSKYPTVFISALTKENFPEMKKMIYDEVMKIHISRFPYNDFLFEYFDNEEEENNN
jgi:GTP-binding protein HflX